MDPPTTLALEYTPVPTKKPISELHFKTLNSNLQRNNKYIKSPSDENKQLLPSSHIRRFHIIPATQNGSSLSSGASGSGTSKPSSSNYSETTTPSTSTAVSPVTSPLPSQQLQPKYAMSLRSLRSGKTKIIRLYHKK